jgi:signal transduction histidine kinase
VFRLVESDRHFTELLPPPNQRRRISVLVDGDKRVTLSVTCAEMAPNEGGDASLVLVFRDVSEEEAVQRLLGHFLANMTHEFRTPLAALGAAIELLLDQLPSLSEAELQELLRSLHLGIFSLQTLIDNLLESASLEAGRFNVSTRRADLREIVGEAARTMEPLLTKYGQHLVLDVPATLPYVRADARRTIQVLINLIANASKYGPADAEITLAATRQDGVVCVIVGDRGVGVPEEQREALFDRFVHFGGQGDSSRYGTGLGLWVVKSIVEAQGGEVGTGDRSGGGSNFWFTVPVAEEA